MATVTFPDNFVFGCATAAYQIEGAWDADGKGPSIWDTFAHTPGKIKHGHSGDIACDHYHRYAEDVALMKEIGLGAYRFSVSWPRIVPDGVGKVNQAGIDFYSRLVDELLAAGIQPFPTLFHWDMPQNLFDRYRGWLGRDTAYRFADYAETMFRALGDRVHHWITHNEPKNVHISSGYVGANGPPEVGGGFEAGLAANHIIMLAHGLAVQAFRSSDCDGEIGITLAMGAARPLSDSKEDAEATERAVEWDVFWNLELLFNGRYSDLTERPQVKALMPQFDKHDLEVIATPMDFLGINHYRANWAENDPEHPLGYHFIWGKREPCDERTGIGWPVTPWSMYETLTMVSARFPDVKLYITENGYADSVPPGEPPKVSDPERIAFLRRYIASAAKAMAEGVNLVGYFVWSLLDNLEWSSGFEPRFGIIAVDFDTQERTLKDSAKWYRELLRARRIEAD
ncbi:MAG: beta-glucosidase [Chitinivibrionales bacterium]|nr:beta-glucosidase [Chitinivibrionales bacterium]